MMTMWRIGICARTLSSMPSEAGAREPAGNWQAARASAAGSAGICTPHPRVGSSGGVIMVRIASRPQSLFCGSHAGQRQQRQQ